MQTHSSLPAEIITIGDEILIGQIVDTNSSWMGQHLNDIGVWIDRVTSVSDRHDAIIDVLAQVNKRVKLVFVTGGLGPTRDDITKQAVCDFFEDHLVRNQVVYDHVESLLGKRGIEMNDLNQKQADVPSKAHVVFNYWGTAPCMRMEKNGTLFYFMPGVPSEMIALMENTIIDEIKEFFRLPYIKHKTVFTQGLGESLLAKKLESFEDNLPNNVHLAYLPECGMVKLRLTIIDEDDKNLGDILDKQIEKLSQEVGEYIVDVNGRRPELALKDCFIEKGLTLSVAESCTGGLIAHIITLIPGSSEYFAGGVVSYSNQVKESQLGVSHQSLIQYGAVSQQVAIEMAEGVRNRLGTDCSIAVTGIAGPGGATDDKPVGTVWIAWATVNQTIAECFHFGDRREQNIQRSCMMAISKMIKLLNS